MPHDDYGTESDLSLYRIESAKEALDTAKINFREILERRLQWQKK